MAGKNCKKCGEYKDLLMYEKDRSRPDGYHPYCKTCRKKQRQRHAETYKDQIAEKKRKYYQDNKDTINKRTLAYYHNNREHILEKRAKRRTTPEWKALNNVQNGARQARTKQATPKWANQEKIQSIYLEARTLEQQDGIKRNVDHIIPLTNNLVCGLHCHDNLQILTLNENLEKGNKFIVEQEKDHRSQKPIH